METAGRAQPLQQLDAKPRLLDLVRGVLRRKHYSIRTEQSYVDWIKRFILFHGKRHPARLPVALTPTEARAVLAQIEGAKWLMASRLYGCGLRSMERLRLRVKDVDFGCGQMCRPRFQSRDL